MKKFELDLYASLTRTQALFGVRQKIGVRLRRAGTHGKGRGKNSKIATNLRSGPILAVLIYSLLRGRAYKAKRK